MDYNLLNLTLYHKVTRGGVRQQPNYGHRLYISISSSSAHSSHFTIQFLWGLNEWREPIKKKNGVKSFSIQLKCQDLCKSQLVLSVKPLQFDSEFLTSGPLLTSSWGCFFESKVADGHHLGVLIGCRCLQVISREERSGLMCHFEIAFKCKKLSAAFTPLGVCDELWTFFVCVYQKHSIVGWSINPIFCSRDI